PMPERPNVVKRGVLFLWLSYACGLLETGWSFYSRPQDYDYVVEMIFAIVFVAAIFGVFALIIYRIWMRRRWARIAYVTVAIATYSIGFSSGDYSLQSLQVDGISMLLDISSIITDVIGMTLMFTRPANRWFRMS